MARREAEAQWVERVLRALGAVDRGRGAEYQCCLDHKTLWQLSVAVTISAQCTDAKVNIVTRDLFRKYDTLEKFTKADLKELKRDVHSTGFYHNKTKDIITCYKKLAERYNGEVPSTVEELISLVGAGRRAANVTHGNIYGEPSTVADTHVRRTSRKLGFVKEEGPGKIEYELMKVIPKDH